MLDFFPDSLRALERVAATDDPFAFCPWFDAYLTVHWPDGAPRPLRLSKGDGVRPRMLARLFESAVELPEFLRDYEVAATWKVPLLYWGEDSRMLTPHVASERISDRVQLALAHFKF